MTIKGMEHKRLFVGNLFPEVTSDDLEKKFSSFGEVSKIEIKTKKDIDGNVAQTFAFIDINCGENGISQCISTIANKKWKGSQITVQQARESFMDRLARERASKAGEGEKRKGSVSENVEGKKSIYSEKPAEKKLKFSDASENFTNLGEVNNGIVSFDEKTAAAKSQSKSKAYHSSSEEEEGGGGLSQQVNTKKKSSVVKKSIEDKEKLRQRFLEKQKLSTAEKAVKPLQVAKPKGKYYEGSSDEEEEENKEDKNNQTGEEHVKESGDVFKNLKTFSNVWQDSDDEEEDDDSESDSTEDSSESEEDEEVSNTKRANLHKQLQETAGNTDSDPNSKHVITRYDPTLDDQDQFLRSDDGDSKEKEKGCASDLENKETKTFEIRTDLKQAFGGGGSSSGFSFGFLGGAPQENDSNNGKTDPFLPSAEYESDNEEIITVTKPKVDIGARFGMQLKGKGVTKSSRSFFFTPEDPRLEDGVKFFFEHEVDVDNIRGKFNEKRPILSDILKKRLRNKQKRMQPVRGSAKKKGSWQGQGGQVKRHSHKSKNK